jgi:hypothetical protein
VPRSWPQARATRNPNPDISLLRPPVVIHQARLSEYSIEVRQGEGITVKATSVALIRRARTPVLVTMVSGLGLALGVGGALLLWGGGGAAAPVPSAARVRLPKSVAQPGPRPIARDAAPVPALEPSSAREALTNFFQAQIDNHADAAYALITADSRRRFPSLSTWQRGTADRLLPAGFEVGAERPAEVDHGQAVDVDVNARHAPALDTFSGLVPGRARETWRVWREDDHWRVDPEPVKAVPVLPLDQAAEDVVRGWVAHMEACDESGARTLQVSSLLYGPIQLGRAPCKEPGAWKVGLTTRFDAAPDNGAYVAAFGPGIGSWGRLVPVKGPRSHFFAAVGPMGDDWRVIGVLVDGAGG